MKATYGAALTGMAMAGLIAACAPQMSDKAQARNDFNALCVDCHGASGHGDGPAAAGMVPHPVDLTRVAANNGGVFPRLQVMGHIYGFTPGRSESPMPQFGELLDGPTIPYDAGDGVPTPTPARLVALMEHVEAMQR
ncbi:cytochrome C [Paracoccus sp. YIM 132242]|uniref:Cytochrome C n=1 Tax=Paracoccus lichenicola TaxID=2665644 RepID=A0A6L6HLB5_9RHOB|nr:cytochrome C [Paracoccus lichenicola]MTD99030.1 cytochrome C [Paracoccus lichenicola]